MTEPNSPKDRPQEPELIRVYLAEPGKPYSTLEHLRIMFSKSLSASREDSKD